MSLVKTLAKVAAGVVVAKAVKGAVSGGQPRRGGATRASTGGGLEDILGEMLGSGNTSSRNTRGGGLEDMLGQVLGGGGATSRTSSGGGLEDMLGQVLGGGTPTSRGAQGGSLQDMLGQVLSGRAGPAAAGGGLGGMLDELSQLSRPGESRGATGGFGDLLNQSLERFDEPATTPTAEQEELAGVLLRAMIQSAKADGQIDAGEKSRLLEKLGDVSQEEMEFVNAELKRPVDVVALARSVPRGAEQQVYMVSAMAIDLDQRAEAQYLADLAGALRLDGRTVNAIHDRMGVQRIFG
ncbi:DUF533 domain-containing protein [Tropicimonas marinistellae]|uniref:DUF533 domain-containing protein n=1 Tax=Tropicimonas marinistellae TaxID=1739787 RepID=UPI0009901D41|nr:DUF533 domain-containing protein [Tropicimonas marinistellae]